MVDKTYLLSEPITEVENIEPEFVGRWEKYSVEPKSIKCLRDKDYGVEDVYIVALHNNEVILYDEVEEEFGIGKLDSDNILRNWELFDSVSTCIKCFPGGKYYE